MELRSVAMRTDVTCVAFYEHHVISGMGNSIYIFEIPSAKFLQKMDVFHGQKVHGIVPGEGKLIAVFGGRLLQVISLDLTTEIQFCTVCSWHVDDWILCLHWLKGGNELAIVTAHNVVSLWNWKTGNRLETIYCEEKCILYSAILVGDLWEQLVVMAGTVFREVVLWTPVSRYTQDSPVLHRLSGHQGVIFSISFNPRIGYIYTTSCDRTVGVWKVEPHCPVSWTDAKIELKHKVFGHSARVWRCIGLDDVFVSIGEDSQLCMWDRNGCLLKRWATHQGGSVWSIDCNEGADLIVTGGGDGGISLWPLRRWRDTSLRPVPLPFPETEDLYIPRRIILLASGNIVVVTDSGCLLHCLVQGKGNGRWYEVLCDARLVNYCLLEVSSCRHLVALATLNGHVLIFQENITCEPVLAKIVDTPAAEGKIFSLHWLSEKLLLTCGPLGKLEMWALRDGGGVCYLARTHEFLLPPSKERWLTSALLVDSSLLCGDRLGSIHIYSLCSSKESQNPSSTLLKLHGRLGVSSLACFGGCLYSTGRDGTLRQHQLLTHSYKLQPVCSHRLPMEWVASISDSPHGLLVAGFMELNFVIWSQKEQRILVEVPCGGGHRSWDCSVKTQGFSFAHIKDKQVHLFTCLFEMLVRPVLQAGFHVRTVNCMKLFKQSGCGGPVFVSGGEDTTVRVTEPLHDNHLRVLSIQRSHISSVRALALCPLSETSTLLFSAGGRAQIKAWNLEVTEIGTQQVICQELTTHMLHSESYGQRKPWRLMEPKTDSETRYMSLHAIHTSSNLVQVFAGCSDGILRLFHFNLDCQELLLMASCESHSSCILLVSCIPKLGVVLSMATDGNIAFWELDLLQSDTDPFFVCQLHKSGINSHILKDINENTILMATGGDDNALVLTAFKVQALPKKSAKVLLQWRKDDAHATQVTGLAFVDKYLVSTSIDQRVLMWRWECDISCGKLEATVVSEFCSTVADIQGLEAWCSGSDLNVCVYGRGMEIISGKMRH